MDPITEFENEVNSNIARIRDDEMLKSISEDWMYRSMELKYAYNFKWLGRPIIQFPQDILAMQEIIWEVKPDLIIETGIAHGGSLIFYSSMLKLLNASSEKIIDREVVGVDIDIRQHNRREIEKHPMNDIIHMIQGSSTDDTIVDEVRQISNRHDCVIVILDSNHTGDHVLEELRKYESMVNKGGYIIVMDTITKMLYSRIEQENSSVPEHLARPWDSINNAMTGLETFLRENNRFVYDERYDKLCITSNPGGYLRCIG